MTLEEEYQALKDWHKQKSDENDKAAREAWIQGKIRGLDSEFDVISKQINGEYNRRLDALKERYGIGQGIVP
jgi:hypothetical protein